MRSIVILLSNDRWLWSIAMALCSVFTWSSFAADQLLTSAVALSLLYSITYLSFTVTLYVLDYEMMTYSSMIKILGPRTNPWRMPNCRVTFTRLHAIDTDGLNAVLQISVQLRALPSSLLRYWALPYKLDDQQCQRQMEQFYCSNTTFVYFFFISSPYQ